MKNEIRTSKLTRSQKILLSLYQLSNGASKQVRFEDIAVAAYKNFAADFQLKGYPQYPDTGDIIHKPLYSELKKGGYILSGNKYFSLTPKGITYAKKLLSISQNKDINAQSQPLVKLTVDQQKELDRLKSSVAVELFLKGRPDEILDIDFYSYLGVTVRTNKYDFLGRLRTVEDAISVIQERSDELYKKLRECHNYLLEKFKANIDFVRSSKGGGR
ncbi:hypothetical protein HGA88_01770 [Candidatus Roizmanbacteria bacterium]|nr:hypothetical protein [Candidatus Roizmanbacteria bacterium]